MTKKCVIIIPIYIEDFNFDTYMSINNTYTLYKDIYDIYFICSKTLNISKYKLYFPIAKYKFFDSKFFVSQPAYSYLMLNYLFYKEFLNYEYMLIVQTDAYIFNNYNLEYFINKNYVLLGALVGWGNDIFTNNLMYGYENNLTLKEYKQKFNNNTLFFGGGLTLRKIDVLYHILKNFYSTLTNKMNNDEFYYNDISNLNFFEDYKIFELLYNFNMLDNILFRDIIHFAIDKHLINYSADDHQHINLYKDLKIIPFGCHKLYYDFIDIIK